MDRGLSIWLDVLRSAAALAVLAGHMAHIRFTGGDYYVLREINLASDAVVVFFVISGVVIAYAAGRDGSPGRYAFNRMTRLFSVLVPALGLTFVLDAIGTRIDPAAYPAPHYQPAGLSDFLFRGLTLSIEWTGMLDRVRLGTNGPLWSLSYEAAYYVLFGIAVFGRGIARIGLLALCALLFGMPILMLFPAWLLGVLVWRYASRIATAPSRPGFAWTLALMPIALLVAARVVGVPQILSHLTMQAFASGDHHAVLGYSDEVAWNMLIALGIALHLAGIAQLAHRGFRTFAGAGAIRWIAGATFSIYAVHYPVLHVLDAALPEGLLFRDLGMLICTLAICLFFAEIFERPISAFRQTLHRFGRTAPA